MFSAPSDKRECFILVPLLLYGGSLLARSVVFLRVGHWINACCPQVILSSAFSQCCSVSLRCFLTLCAERALDATCALLMMHSTDVMQVGIILDRIFGSGDPEVFVDQVSDLSSSEKVVLFLGSLFLQTDLFLETDIMDDPVQCFLNQVCDFL